MKVLFGTVVYDTAWKYRKEFMRSLNEQKDCDFDILVINDNVEQSKIKELYSLSNRNIKIFSTSNQMSIAELRVYLLKVAKKLCCDLLILGDFDDVFEENRVSKTMNCFSEKQGFYYNSIETFEKQPLFTDLPKHLECYEEILEYNFLGLSNTAINLSLIDLKFINSLLEGNTNIFDWYLYTRLMLIGFRGLLVEDTCTYYRIYDENIAGLEIVNTENLKKEILIKTEHYGLLKEYTQLLEERYIQYKSISQECYHLCLNKNSKGYWWNKIQVKAEEK